MYDTVHVKYLDVNNVSLLFSLLEVKLLLHPFSGPEATETLRSCVCVCPHVCVSLDAGSGWISSGLGGDIC